jgi:ribosomal protein S18 acetylase RimI-like enzyme
MFHFMKKVLLVNRFSVREAILEDIDDIVHVHLKSFPSFFLTSLGEKFLAEYYNIYIQYNHIAFVVEDNGKIEGFVVGTNSSEEFYRDFKSNIQPFLIPIITNIFNPKLVSKIFNRIYSILFKKRVNDVLKKYNDINELTSIGVLPSDQKKGLGSILLGAYESYCLNEKIKGIYLTTDAANNDSVLNFYKKSGFEIDLTFYQSEERKMYSLTKYL